MFSTIDVLVNNGGIFYAKPCTDFTTDDFDALASVNLLRPLYHLNGCETDGEAEVGERCDRHGDTCRSPDCWREYVGLYD